MVLIWIHTLISSEWTPDLEYKQADYDVEKNVKHDVLSKKN